MKKSRASYAALSITVVLAVMCTAESCDDKKVLKEIRSWNIDVGEALVASDELMDDLYKAKVEEVTQTVIDGHAADPDWTPDMAEAEYKKRMASWDEHNDRFEDATEAIALSQEALEQALDAADHINNREFKKSVRDILNGFTKLVDVLNMFAQDTDNDAFKKATNLISTVTDGASKLIAMLGGVDEDDPMDD